MLSSDEKRTSRMGEGLECVRERDWLAVTGLEGKLWGRGETGLGRKAVAGRG